MPFNRYYRHERAFLREDFGPDFAKANPAIASTLGSASSDPDVERLLDGFAFFTGRIREKLDDEYPELIYTLLGIFCPQLLNPTPSATIIQFDPLPNRLTSSRVVAKGTILESDAVDGVTCTFRTCADVAVRPLRITSASVANTGNHLRLTFEVAKGISLSNLDLDRLRLYVAGESAFELYAALTEAGCKAHFRAESSGRHWTQQLHSPSAGGLSPDESIWPFPGTSFQGYRLLHEYLVFPEKFLFVDVSLGDACKGVTGPTFSVEFDCTRPLPVSWRPSPDAFKLNCVPAVNLFEEKSYPVDISHLSTEYRVKPTQPGMEIYSILQARAWVAGTAEPRRYEPLLSLERDPDVTYYTVQMRQGVNEEDRRTYICLADGAAQPEAAARETAEFSLLCSNGALASRLMIGSICRPTDSSPDFANFQNISRVSHYVPVSAPSERPWQLLSHLGLSPSTLESVISLRSVLDLYNFPDSVDVNRARANRGRIEALLSLSASPRTFIMTRESDPECQFAGLYGLPVRGRAVEIDLQGSKFSSEGDIFLFGTVLSHFFSQYASMNSVVGLKVSNLTTGSVYQWPPRSGEERLI